MAIAVVNGPVDDLVGVFLRVYQGQGPAQGPAGIVVQVIIPDGEKDLGNVPIGVPDFIEAYDLPDPVVIAPDEIGKGTVVRAFGPPA